jgi:hypothetical protein
MEEDYEFNSWMEENKGKTISLDLLRECWDEAKRVAEAEAAEQQAGADL